MLNPPIISAIVSQGTKQYSPSLQVELFRGNNMTTERVTEGVQVLYEEQEYGQLD